MQKRFVCVVEFFVFSLLLHVFLCDADWLCGSRGASNHNGVSDHSSGSGSGTGEGSSPKAVTGVAATLRRAGASVGRCFKCRSCHCPKPGCGNPFRKCCQRNGVRASDLASGTSMVATASAAPTAAQKTTRSLTSSLCCCRRSTSNKPIPAPKITSSGEGRFSKLFGCCRRKPAQRGSTIMVQAPSPGKYSNTLFIRTFNI